MARKLFFPMAGLTLLIVSTLAIQRERGFSSGPEIRVLSALGRAMEVCGVSAIAASSDDRLDAWSMSFAGDTRDPQFELRLSGADNFPATDNLVLNVPVSMTESLLRLEPGVRLSGETLSLTFPAGLVNSAMGEGSACGLEVVKLKAAAAESEGPEFKRSQAGDSGVAVARSANR